MSNSTKIGEDYGLSPEAQALAEEELYREEPAAMAQVDTPPPISERPVNPHGLGWKERHPQDKDHIF